MQGQSVLLSSLCSAVRLVLHFWKRSLWSRGVDPVVVGLGSRVSALEVNLETHASAQAHSMATAMWSWWKSWRKSLSRWQDAKLQVVQQICMQEASQMSVQRLVHGRGLGRTGPRRQRWLMVRGGRNARSSGALGGLVGGRE